MKFIRGKFPLLFLFSVLFFSCLSAQDVTDETVSAAPAETPDSAVCKDSPLAFGNPSGAESDLSVPENYLMEKNTFVLSYNASSLCPNWVAWHLCPADFGTAARSNSFRPDSSLPEDWYRVKKSDYRFNVYGFDRGHVCPSADRTFSKEDNESTFLMTNMIPQAPDLNRIVWRDLEMFERSLAESGNELYIFAGPAGSGGKSARGEFSEIPVAAENPEGGEGLAVNVPAWSWKIMLVLPFGDDDSARIGEETDVISVCVPNVQGCASVGSWEQYLTTIDYIEEITGFDFFSALPDELETVLESVVYSPDKN